MNINFSFCWLVILFLGFEFLNSGENRLFLTKDGNCSFFSNNGVILFKFDGCNASNFNFSKDFRGINILGIKDNLLILGVRFFNNSLVAKIVGFNLDGEYLYEMSTSTDSVIAISSMGNYLLTYGAIFIKTNNTYEKYIEIPNYLGDSNYEFSDDENFFAFRYNNPENKKMDIIELFDLRNKSVLKKIKCDTNLFSSLAFSKDSKYIYLICGKNKIKVISLNGFSVVKTINTNPNDAHNIKVYKKYITLKLPYINSVVGYSLKDYSLVWKKSIDDQIIDYNLNFHENILFIVTYHPTDKNKFFVKRIKI